MSGNLQVGSNYIDFGTTGGIYEPAPGYGNFTIDVTSGEFATLGVTSGEGGQIQSLNEGTGTVTLPSAFITFNSGGSQYQLWATTIPAGMAGPFNYVQSGNTTTFTFQVEGYIENTNTSTNVGNFDLTFTFTYPGTPTQAFNNLPYNTPYTATNS
jgi:hypothetical protein